MVEQTTRYGIATTVEMDYPRAVERTKEELAKEGFGVLSEIDISATLKKKLDADFRPYVILGACNPPLAHRALSQELGIGLLLPCNVIVYEEEGSGEPSTVVSIVDPVAMMEVANSPALASVAEEAQARLRRVAAALAA